MAKKKKVNLDKEYNVVLKNKFKECFVLGCTKLVDTIGFDLCESTINDMKDLYIKSSGEFAFSLVQAEDIITILDYSLDILLGISNINLVFNKISENLSNMFERQGYVWEPFIAINRLSGKYDLLYGYDDNSKTLSAYIVTLTIYSILSKNKVKNKSLKGFITKDNALIIDYHILNKYDINTIKNTDNVISEFTTEILTSCNEYLHTHTFKAPKRYDWDTIMINNAFNDIPLSNKDSSLYIEMNELCKIPNNRLYSFPSTGIKFNFIDKNFIIDNIIIKELGDSFICDITIINNGDILVGQMSEIIHTEDVINIDKEKIHYIQQRLHKLTSNVFIFTHKIPKDSLFKFKSYEDVRKNTVSQDINYWLGLEKNYIVNDFENKLIHCIMSCIYIAYYCPNKFAKDIMLTIVGNKQHSSCSNRESGYRQEYIRRLPKGYSHSKEAEQLAREKGYLSIPQGYTFVSESNLDKKEAIKQKVIRIKQ